MTPRDRAVERLALLLFSGAPDAAAWADAMHILDREVAAYKTSAARGEGNMPVAWELALQRARAVLDMLGLVAVDPALVERLQKADAAVEAARATKRGVYPGDDETNAFDDAAFELAAEVLAQLGAKP